MSFPGPMLGPRSSLKGKQEPGRRIFNRRNFLFGLGSSLTTLGIGNGQAQREIAVKVHRIITDSKIPPIIACADMHVGGTGSTLEPGKFERAIEHARTEVLKHTTETPVFCVAGDFACSANWVAHTTHQSFGDFYDIFGALAQKNTVFGSRGNHDVKLADWSKIESQLGGSISFLRQSKLGETFGNGFQVLSMPDFNSQSDLYTDEMMNKMLKTINSHTGTSFILCHDPDGVDFFEKWCLKNGHKVLQSTLFFCGHTHGGLVGYPIIDRLIAQKTPLHLKSDYVRGTYPSVLGPHVKIVVSVGIGSYLEASFRYGAAMPTIHAFVSDDSVNTVEAESIILTK